MLTKLLSVLFCISLLLLPLLSHAQKQQASGRTDSAIVEKRRQELRFDPRKPQLQKEFIEAVQQKIQKELLKRTFPEDMTDFLNNSAGFHDHMVLNVLANYDALIKNFELEEVTRVPLAWYKKYREQIAAFNKAMMLLTDARLTNKQDIYAAAVAEFKKQQAACLAFLKKKQPKIGSEQLIKIRNANTRRRRAEYNARIKKEREEQLKKLQKEKSQKNTNK